MEIEFFLLFVWVYRYSLPALLILTGIKVAVGLIKYFKNKKAGTLSTGTESKKERTIRYLGIVLRHAFATIVSSFLVPLVLIPFTMFVPVPAFYIIALAISTAIIFLLEKFVKWLTPKPVTTEMPHLYMRR